jgi:hypothetical protein
VRSLRSSADPDRILARATDDNATVTCFRCPDDLWHDLHGLRERLGTHGISGVIRIVAQIGVIQLLRQLDAQDAGGATMITIGERLGRGDDAEVVTVDERLDPPVAVTADDLAAAISALLA